MVNAHDSVGFCYCPRGFPSRDELAALCVYFDRVVVLPPAPSVLTLPGVTRGLDDPDELRSLSAMARPMTHFEDDTAEFYAAGMVAHQDWKHSEALAVFTAKVLGAIREDHPEIPNTVSELLRYYDSLVCALFADAGRDLVVVSASSEQLLPKPDLDVGVALVGEALPVVVSEDPEVVRDIRSEVRVSVERFKLMVREKAYETLGPSVLAQPMRAGDPRLAELRSFVRQQIEIYKRESKMRLEELASQKRAAGASAAVGALAGVSLMVTDHQIPGLAALLAVAPVARRWRDLADLESEASHNALSGPGGLFLAFERVELNGRQQQPPT